MERNGDPTRRAFRRALAAEGAVIGCVWGGALAAAAILAAAVAFFTATGCTASYSQSAAGDISATVTIVQPSELQK